MHLFHKPLLSIYYAPGTLPAPVTLHRGVGWENGGLFCGMVRKGLEEAFWQDLNAAGGSHGRLRGVSVLGAGSCQSSSSEMWMSLVTGGQKSLQLEQGERREGRGGGLGR